MHMLPSVPWRPATSRWAAQSPALCNDTSRDTAEYTDLPGILDCLAAHYAKLRTAPTCTSPAGHKRAMWALAQVRAYAANAQSGVVYSSRQCSAVTSPGYQSKMGMYTGTMANVSSSVQPLDAGCFIGAKCIWVVHSEGGAPRGSCPRLGTHFKFVCVALSLRDNLDAAT
jgi:hypothetical protein